MGGDDDDGDAIAETQEISSENLFQGGNRPPRRQAHPRAPSLPRGAPKGRHNRHFQPALERAKWAEKFFRLRRLMDGILNMGLAVQRCSYGTQQAAVSLIPRPWSMQHACSD
jgi:hypothetical protein